MAGNNSTQGLETVTFTDNMSFDGTERGGAMTTNGELWIGSTALPHVKKGTLTSSNGTVTITPGSGTIDLTASASTPIHFTEDSGAAVPAAGNLNVFGQQAGTIPVMFTIGAGSTIDIEDRTWISSLVVDPSATVGLRGTYQTIATALAAATSGQSIYIRPGTYTENLTLVAGVNLFSMTGDAQTPNVTIIGNCTATFAGSATLSGIRLQTNSASALTVSGSSATIIKLVNCYINASNNLAITFSAANASALIECQYCRGNIGSATAFFVQSSTGTLRFLHCNLTNTANSITANLNTAGNVFLSNSYVEFNFRGSTTGGLIIVNSFMNSAVDVGMVLFSGSGTNKIFNSTVISGTSSPIAVNTNSGTVANVVLSTSNTDAISGSGTLTYSDVTTLDVLPRIAPGLALQIPGKTFNSVYPTTAPSSYPYTVLPQDGFIFVDTSGARTINLNASPVRGQWFIIKDNVGSAAANNITVVPAAGNIDGAGSYVMNINYGSITVVYNGTQWNIV